MRRPSLGLAWVCGLGVMSAGTPALGDAPLSAQVDPSQGVVSRFLPGPSSGPIPSPFGDERPHAIPRVVFAEAVSRAMRYGAAVLSAQSEAHQKDAQVIQARAASLPSLTVGGLYSRLDADRVLGQGDTQRLVAGANQLSGNLTVSVPLFAPARWAAWLHARDNLEVARFAERDTRNKAALAAARAYLLVLAQKRLLAIAERASAVANEHFVFASRRQQEGLGHRLDELRAQTEQSITRSQLHQARAALRKSQENLGVLIGHDGPIDAHNEPEFPAWPPEAAEAAEAMATSQLVMRRQDLAAIQTRAWAAARLLRHRFTDYLPTLSGSFAPFFQDPPSIVQPLLGWQARVELTWNLFDGGLRYGQRAERQAQYEQIQAVRWSALLAARSEVRAATFAVAEARETRAAAEQAKQAAQQAAEMAEKAFLAGATSNLEVIDANRRAQDAHAQAIQALDALLLAQLERLYATGHFPPTQPP